MRVAVPSDDEQRIAPHTGRCRGFAIYDLNGDQIQKLEYRSFESAHHSHAHLGHGSETCSHDQHDGGGHSHHGLVETIQDCDVFLAIGMGPRLVNDLQAYGIKIIFTLERDITKAVAALAQGKLVENPHGSACHQHGNR